MEPTGLRFAVVDIGSNAIRFQVSSVYESHEEEVSYKKLEFIRFPLRLGHDVFTTGRIGLENEIRFIKLMNTFKLLMELYQVNDYLFAATSAMREAENGKEIVAKVKELVGVEIKIITGTIEADLLNKVIQSRYNLEDYVHIDLGGGSTEINIYRGGEKVTSRSFRIGTVRLLDKKDNPETWKELQLWLKENVTFKAIGIGTGGNINKLHDLSGLKDSRPLSLAQIRKLKKTLEGMTYEERMAKYYLNPDRADVIVPACEVFSSVMGWAGLSQIYVPKMGLKEGIVQELYQKHTKRRFKKVSVLQSF